MTFIWHQTAHIDSRVLELHPPHKLGEWEVYHPYGSGAGTTLVKLGPSAVPPPEVAAMLRVSGVWRVIVAEQGFFIVTVIDARHWSRIESEVIQAYVKSKEKADANRPAQG